MAGEQLAEKLQSEIARAFSDCSISGRTSKIAVIKRARMLTGLDLKDTKEAVEAYARQHNIVFEEGTAGCGTTALFFVVVVVALPFVSLAFLLR